MRDNLAIKWAKKLVEFQGWENALTIATKPRLEPTFDSFYNEATAWIKKNTPKGEVSGAQ